MGNNSTHYYKNNRYSSKKNKKNNNSSLALSDAPTEVATANTNLPSPKKSPNITNIRKEGTFFEDFEQILPDEILVSILLRCNTYTLSVVAPKVCKQFYNNTLANGYLWQQKCKLKNRRLLAGLMQQNRTFKYIYITQKRFVVRGNTQNIKKTDQKAELTQLLLTVDKNGLNGEGKYIKFFQEYHARWTGTISDDFDVKIEEYYNYEQYPYYYEGKLDPELGVIKGKYHKNNIEGVFEFVLTPKVVIRNKQT